MERANLALGRTLRNSTLIGPSSVFFRKLSFRNLPPRWYARVKISSSCSRVYPPDRSGAGSSLPLAHYLSAALVHGLETASINVRSRLVIAAKAEPLHFE